MTLLGAACAHRVDTAASATLEVQAAQEERSAEEVDTHVVDEPDRITTTVEEYEAATAPDVTPGPTASDYRRSSDAVSGARPQQPIGSVPAHSILVKRTVRVEEHGAVVTDTRKEAAQEGHSVATVNAQAKAQTHTESHPALPSCGFGGALWGVLGIVAVAGIAWMRRASLLGLAAKAIKAVLG